VGEDYVDVLFTPQFRSTSRGVTSGYEVVIGSGKDGLPLILGSQ
jgi:hypothetical protein